MTRLGSRGEGRLGCFLWAVVLGVGILIAAKAVPVKLVDVEFGDYIEEQAQFSGRTGGEELRKRILKKAKELEIPLDKKKLKVTKSTRRVQVECSYTVTVDLIFRTYDWTFEHDIDQQIFII